MGYNPTGIAFTQKAPVFNSFTPVKDVKKSTPTRIPNRRNPFPSPVIATDLYKQKPSNKITNVSRKPNKPSSGMVSMQIKSNDMKVPYHGNTNSLKPNNAIVPNRAKSNNLFQIHGKSNNANSPTVSKSINALASSHKLNVGPGS